MKWFFPSNNGGEIQGLNDAGIEVFKDNPIKSLAREICQNSLDAHLDEQKVIVEFKTFQMLTDDYPDRNTFLNVLLSCKKVGLSENDQEVVRFFDNAYNQLTSTNISMLRISDFNTKGLGGNDWANLIVKSGASAKKGTEGGRFGIGKRAPFACSDLRTVFYSTLNKDGEMRSEGVSRLISHGIGIKPNGNIDISQGTGYLAVEHNDTFTFSNEMFNLDTEFHRQASGTDIYIPALIDYSDFESTIIAEVLDGFLYSIYNDKLEVKVNEQIINNETLTDIVQKYKTELNDNTIMCYQLLVANDVNWNIIPIKLAGQVLGNIKFGFQIRIDGTNKVTMIRNMGMKIFDKTGLCPSLRFVGMAIIEGDNLNKFLHDIEDISHDKWAPNRHANPRLARQLLSDIFSSITNKLKEEASLYAETEIDIEGASEYLPDEFAPEDNGNNVQPTNTEYNKILSVETKIIKKVKSVAHLETDDIGNDIESIVDDQGEAITGDGYETIEHQGHKEHGVGERDTVTVGSDDGNEAIKKVIYVKAKDLRVFCINKKEHLYRVVLNPEENSDRAFVEIIKIAEQNEKMPMKIISVQDDTLMVANNKIGYFKLKYGVNKTIEFTIADDEYSTMEVKVYAYTE